MAAYKVTPKPSIEKDLRSLSKPLVERILKRIESLKDDPFPRGSVKLEGGEKLYRIRVGDYRIVYEVDNDAKHVTINYVRHRREVYRGL